jgi:TonB-linked SusC/RagA family outer membrane protein
MMKVYIRVLLALTLLLFAVSAGAQNRFAVRGKVLDNTTGEPILGATVVEVSEADGRFLNGTISDFNGDFVLEVQGENSIIKVSFIGFTEQRIELKGKSFFTVKLSEDVKQLAGVDIVATRQQSDGLVSIPKRDMTGSSVSVDFSQMQEVAATTVEDAIQGQLGGVDIVMNSGNPGSGATFVIRGMSSLNGSKPLFVINGIPNRINVGDDFDFASADQEDIGQLVSIAPADIKSITVLKDAASCAPYGSDGANGVIVIETKSGTKGKPQFNFDYKYNYRESPKSIPMLNGDEYITLQREQRFNPTGLYTLADQLAQDPRYRDFYNYNKNTDWVSAVTRSTRSHEYNMQVSGGGDRTTYIASVNYTTDNGTTINTNLKRLSNRVKLDYKVSDKILFQAEFAYSKMNQELSPDYNFSGNNRFNGRNVRSMAYLKMPNMSIWEYDANGVKTGNYFTPYLNYQGKDNREYFNPVAMAVLGMDDATRDQIVTNFSMRYDILKGLQFKPLVSYIYQNDTEDQFIPYSAMGANWLNPHNNVAQKINEDRTQLLVRLQLNYYKTFSENKHVFNSGFTWDMFTNKSTSLLTATTNTASVYLTNPAAVAPWSAIKMGEGENRKVAGRGYVNYKLLDRYIASVNFSIEGSSRMGIEKRWGIFPSGSLAWRLGSEPVLENITWLGKESRIRYSYGIQGNDGGIGNFDRHALYSPENPYITNPVFVPKQVQLENLKWETTTQQNVGIDAELFREKLRLVFEFYRKNTTDLIWTGQNAYPLPYSSGYSNLKVYNSGELENRGWEFSFDYDIFRSNDRKWIVRANGNVSQNSNRFISFPETMSMEKDGTLDNKKYPKKVNLGEPIGSFYGVQYLGVYAYTSDAIAYDAAGNPIYDMSGEPLQMSYRSGQNFFQWGDAIYKDINNDGSIDIYDAIYLGDANPKIFGGFGGSVEYKSLTFKFTFFSRYKFDIANVAALDTEAMNSTDNQSKAVLYRKRFEGDNLPGVIPRAYWDNKYNSLGSDRYIEDGSFLRLNNVTIAWRVPKSLCAKLGIRSATMNLNGRKLMTWTNYSGQDPEIAPVGGNAFYIGADNSKTPVPKVFSFSLNVGF